MADIVTGKIFVDGEKGITATKLNQIQSLAVIQPSFYSAKPSTSSLDPTDALLDLKASGSFAQITGSQLITSLTSSLTPNMQQAVNAGLLSESAAYTLLSSDSGKYVICSGGSWALTLPTPAAGLNYRIRNDQGITGTTGTITLTPTPTSGTIDGASTLALLPGQECWLLTDGTNWRTFGRQREVVIGTMDITSATANATILLPVGYRQFVLDFDALVTSADADVIQMQFSSNGGTSFLNTGYYYVLIFNSAAAASTSQGTNTAYASIGAASTSSSGLGHLMQVKVYPGSSTQLATWLGQNSYYNIGGVYLQQILSTGSYGGAPALMNAVKFTPSSGVINNMFLTVKGVV